MGVRVFLALSVAMVSPVFALLCAKLTAASLRVDFTRYRPLLRRHENLLLVHMAVWMAASAAIIYWLRWGQLVRFKWGLGDAFLLDDILILAPILLPLVASWAAFWEVERAICSELSRQTETHPREFTRLGYVMLHARHHLGILLVPVLVLLALHDIVRILAPRWLESGNIGLFMGGLLVSLLVLFPVLLRYVWRTRPLPAGPLRNRLEESARRMGVDASDILVWETDGRVTNAAVTGVWRRFRYVFLTDGLLGRLADEEIEAVFAHEAGHVRHKHLLLRMMAMAAPLSMWLLAEQVFPGFAAQVRQSVDQLHGGLTAEAAGGGVLLLAAATIYIIAIFGPYSRLLEHQADLFSLRSLSAGGDMAPAMAIGSALEKLAANGTADRNKRTWQHSSVARRVDFLNRVDIDPKSELHFQRRMVFANCLVVGIVLSPMLGRLLIG